MNSTPLNTRIALGFRFLGLGLLLLNPVMSSGFDNRTTHRDLTRVSIRSSGLDQFLKTTLRLDQGVNAPLSGAGMSQAISGWLEDGSQREDEPDCRASNHFHNPLKPFVEAGVTDQDGVGLWCWATTEYKPAYASVTWGTGFTAPQTQGSGTTRNQQFDWKAARTAYVNALKASAPSDREAALAQTFLTLGYILHLVQDLAVPAHVRDDFQSHLADCRVDPDQPVTSWCGNSLEVYLRDNGAVVQDILTRISPTAIPFQDAYVTRFWDTDQYTGTNPSADTTQGLAEYVNANFASPNTLFTEGKLPGERYRFLYPAKTSTNLAAVQAKSVDALKPCLAPDGRMDKGWYVTKHRDGDVVPYFAQASYLYRNAVQTFPPPPQDLLFQLDHCVHRSYAERLLPRAVGYSAGLLNYFFRGTLDFEVKVAKNEGQDDPNKRELTITNTSSEQMEGRFSLYAEDAAGVRRRVDNVVGLTDAILLAPGATTSEQIAFVPLNQVAVKAYVLVFNGKLGNEGTVSTDEGAVGAIAGKVKPWEQAVVFAVQETAAFTGEEKQSSGQTDYEAWRSRSKFDSLKQRATGHFAVPGEAGSPGRYIKTIRLYIDRPPDPDATDQVILRLKDSATGQHIQARTEWSRDPATDPPFNPDTWEITLALPDWGSSYWDYHLGASVWQPRFPRFVEIETLAGATWKMPLLWWGWVQTSSRAAVRKDDGCGSWPNYTCRQVSSTETGISATVFFGDGDSFGRDLKNQQAGEWGTLGGHFPYEQSPHTRVGFVPVGPVGGFGVGTIIHTSGWPRPWESWCPTGALSATSVGLFATTYGSPETSVWQKDTVGVSHGSGAAIEKPDYVCPLPTLPPVPDPPELPDLSFRRDYLPAEQAQFGQLGVTPPEHTVTLQIQATPTP